MDLALNILQYLICKKQKKQKLHPYSFHCIITGIILPLFHVTREECRDEHLSGVHLWDSTHRLISVDQSVKTTNIHLLCADT